jgi:hypothetical protein
VTAMPVHIPRQRTVARVAAHRAVPKPSRPTPFLDLLWMVPLTVASYAVALIGGAWIVGVL